MAQQSVGINCKGDKLKVQAAPTTANKMTRAFVSHNNIQQNDKDFYFPWRAKAPVQRTSLESAKEKIWNAVTLALLEDQDKFKDNYTLQILLELTTEHFVQEEWQM
jgi:hypothetical protein